MPTIYLVVETSWESRDVHEAWSSEVTAEKRAQQLKDKALARARPVTREKVWGFYVEPVELDPDTEDAPA